VIAGEDLDDESGKGVNERCEEREENPFEPRRFSGFRCRDGKERELF
jgi:hypothetical protein